MYVLFLVVCILLRGMGCILYWTVFWVACVSRCTVWYCIDCILCYVSCTSVCVVCMVCIVLSCILGYALYFLLDGW